MMNCRIRALLRGLLIALMMLLLGQAVFAGLLDYVARPESQYRWWKAGQQTVGDTTVIDLNMTSQVWQGIPWMHTIRVYVPADLRHRDTVLLFITGGNPGAEDTAFGPAAAKAIQAPVAILFNIPNQPLFEGKSEDALIAYTFSKYLETGDQTWPLLLPMTKAATMAMDTLQSFARDEYGQELTGFVVAGASKRGWTTWLTGAADQKRVKGIVPMVIDTLNMPAQMPHQIEAWGAYSNEISDYSQRGLQSLMGTKQGQELQKMVDPYSYRERLTMPKLIINGANDPYWVIDALNLYWDGLSGPKSVLYVPNSGHSLNDRARVLNSMAAFFTAVATGKALPKMSWRHGDEPGSVTLTITADPKPAAARVWVIRSPDMDFRNDRWEPTPMTAKDDGFTASVERPAAQNMALFGEAEFSVGGRTFMLSTQVRVVPHT